MYSRSRRRRSAGFTLVEILITTTVMGLVTLGILRVFVQALSIYHYDVGKLLVNKDMRTFTTEMSENATYANYFRIFPSHTNLTRSVNTLINPADPDQGYTTAIVDTSLNDGTSGDCLVLVYKDPANDRLISRILVYFRVPGASTPTPAAGVRVLNRGAIRKLDLTISPSSSLPVFQLIPTIANPSSYPIVIDDVAVASPPLVEVIPATTPVSYNPWGLFYNFYDRSIIVKGELIHRGSFANSVNASATNTYNFTVSPRG